MKLLNPKTFGAMLVVMLILSVIISIGLGAVSISPLQSMAILGKQVGLHSKVSYGAQQESVLTIIRLPRVLLAVLTGAILAMAGAAIQGLFRNPLADSGLIGISSGASVTAVLFIVIGHQLFGDLSGLVGIYALSVVTCVGAFATTVIVYSLSQVNGKTIISTMLLAGIAINALAGALTGLFTYAASDVQLRSITFWALGSLGGATWQSLVGVAPFVVIPLLLLPSVSRPLNALALGEANAIYLGIKTEKVKRTVILLTAIGVGASISVTGIIGFIGLVVPHIIRKIIGPDNTCLLVLSAIAGAILLVIADLISRTLFAPAELPIGIITAIIGAPFFLYLLLKDRKSQKFI